MDNHLQKNETGPLPNTTHKNKQPKFGWRKKWRDKQNSYTHSMKYFSSLKMNEFLIYATLQMNLEHIIPMKKDIHKRPHIVWFYLYEMFRVSDSMEKVRLVVFWVSWERKQGMGCNEYRFSFWNDQNTPRFNFGVCISLCLCSVTSVVSNSLKPYEL